MLTASNGGGGSLGSRSSAPFTPIARQTSIYSLTLDELQNTCEPGKNFGSMNMDEFLKNIWTAEESHAMAAALGSTNESDNNPQSSSAGGESSSTGLVREASLPRQVSLPRTLSRKTVDEVWKDIQQESETKAKERQKQANYGEMTLEDFLVKAGVVRDEGEEAAISASTGFPFGPSTTAGGTFPVSSPLGRANQQAAMEAIAAQNQQQQQQSWLNYQHQLKASQMQPHQFLPQQTADGPGAAYGNAAKRGGQPLAPAPGTSSGSGMEGSSDGGLGHGNGLTLSTTARLESVRGRKRGQDGVVEKTVERRQRRMIKNRESAARSRARKQAYTVELEAEVTQLKEENARLKQQQMLESLIPIKEASPSKKVLRRTKTSPW